ncbi:protein of unknown function DUF523 [Trypanosoma melophagium]|uniref:protein of unknown function DUF523 n=1 Tax=Trypanosoma melophagium TaxID=715481 RepID=UPI00351A7984|nr:protein of unknown function DUF523 [Trypanosoma melophagium]
MACRPLTLGGVDVRRLLHNYRRGLPTSPLSSSLSSSSIPLSSSSLLSKTIEIDKNSRNEVEVKLEGRRRPVLLVSACLLGHAVSYRHGHTSPPPRSPAAFILNCLASEHALLTCIPICPEMDILNMPTPRPPIRLIQEKKDGKEEEEEKEKQQQCYIYGKVTRDIMGRGNELRERLTRRHPIIADELLLRKLTGIDACLFKSRSPSCGVGDARVYNSHCSGSYTKADGFFVHEWVRPAVETMPIVTELQLYFEEEEDEEDVEISIRGNGQHNGKNKYGVLSFVRDFITRFEKRKRDDAQS